MKKLLYLLIFLPVFFLPFKASASATPTVVGVTTTVYYIHSGTGTSDTFSVNVSGSGQNRVGILIVAAEDGAFPTSCTLGGTTMTSIVSVAAPADYKGHMYALASPTAGASQTVVCNGNWTDQSRYGYVYFTLQDAVQTEASLVDVTGSTGAGSGTSNSQSITTNVDGDFLVSWTILSSAGSAETVTDNGSQIRLDNHGFGASGFYAQMTFSYLTQATAGAQSMGYSWDVSSRYDLFVTSLKYQAPTSATVSPPAPAYIIEDL